MGYIIGSRYYGVIFQFIFKMTYAIGVISVQGDCLTE
jgi:hypothetical protein